MIRGLCGKSQNKEKSKVLSRALGQGEGAIRWWRRGRFDWWLRHLEEAWPGLNLKTKRKNALVGLRKIRSR